LAKWPKGGGQRDVGEKSGKSEKGKIRRQKTDDRRQTAEDGGQKTDDRRQTTAGRDQRAGVSVQVSGNKREKADTPIELLMEKNPK
jgi:hypothetical protein